MALRKLQCQPNDRFDPLVFIEHIMPSLIANFEYCYDENDEVFKKSPSTLGYVDLTSNPVLVTRQSVMERAKKGSFHDRFVLCHEIAHVFRHSRSGKILAQHRLDSPERNRANRYFELEANLFGGILLVPPDSDIESITLKDAQKKFQVSDKVVKIAAADAVFWRINRKSK